MLTLSRRRRLALISRLALSVLDLVNGLPQTALPLTSSRTSLRSSMRVTNNDMTRSGERLLRLARALDPHYLAPPHDRPHLDLHSRLHLPLELRLGRRRSLGHLE